MRSSIPRIPRKRLLASTAAALALGAALSACGSSPARAAKSPAAPAATAASGQITIDAAPVPGVGTVLVNGAGRTLYLLTSEKGGKVTCTASNGCTTYWPPVTLPKGATAASAGSGVNKSLLATARAPDGSLYVTYGGYPLYTYAADPGPGHAAGQGIRSFGGTWYAVSTSGAPVTSGAKPSSSTSPASTSPGSSGSSGGYGGSGY